jgi:hypothetical protein
MFIHNALLGKDLSGRSGSPLSFTGLRTGLELSSTRTFAGFADGPSKFIGPHGVCDERTRLAGLCYPNLTQRTFICAQDLGGFRVLFDILDDIDQIGNLREEGIIIREPKRLFVVIAGLADIQCGLNVRVNQPTWDQHQQPHSEGSGPT